MGCPSQEAGRNLPSNVLNFPGGIWNAAEGWKRQFGVMNRFLSNATNRIDSKGRVSVPSVFRAVMARTGTEELYVWQDFVFPAISLAGVDVLERFERMIGSQDPFSEEANKMSLLIHGGGVFMKLDAEGRLQVSEFIRDFTAITDRVTFAGRGDHFQLWEPSAFERMQAQARQERTSAAKPSA